MSKREYKKDYKRGAVRGDLIRAVMSFGVVTTDGFRRLDHTPLSMQRCITRMEDEGLMKSYHIAYGAKVSYLLNFEQTSPVYLPKLPAGYYGYYNAIPSKRVPMLYKMIKHRKDTDADRTMRESEAAMYFTGSGVKTLWEDKTDIRTASSSISLPAYYTSTEVKQYRVINEQNKSENLRSAGVLPSSRIIGTLITEDTFYPCYLVGNTLHKLRTVSEERYGVANIQTVMRDFGFTGYRDKEDCIILYKSTDVYRRMCMPQNEMQEKWASKLLTVDQPIFNKMYAIPFYEKGSYNLIEKMTHKGWEEKILRDVLGEYSSPTTNFACDSVKKGVHEFVYCIPNIMRFSSFATAVRNMDNPKIFKVYCYSWQEKEVRALVGDKAQVEIVAD